MIQCIAWTLGGLFTLALIYYVAIVTTRGDEGDIIVASPPVAADSECFVRSLEGVTSNPVLAGNECRVFQNGDEIFPPMLEAIDAAMQSVHFTTYIYWTGEIARKFAKGLAAAARRGAEVRVVLDWFGAHRMDRALLDEMKSAGCDVRFFRPPRWNELTQLNERLHRRLLIIDGCMGFTGGVGVAAEWTGHAQDGEHWRDVHARFRGPAVRYLQGAFVDNWTECAGDLLIGDRYFPAIEPAGECRMSVIQSDPSGGSSNARRFLAACIQAAKTSIYITNAYFVPTPGFIRELIEAERRGVDVKILMPGEKIDRAYVRYASRHTWGELLRGGLELYEYQPAMLHAKTLVVDGCVSAIGSVNFDPRSFSLNDECAVVVVDCALAEEMTRVFHEDIGRAARVDHDQWRSRGWRARALDRLAYLSRGQL
ncbi:MAG: phospholipase D-like domain-containing protein [Gemmatimonadaceae bacterium]